MTTQALLLTGVGGAGKSTVMKALAKLLIAREFRVAAVDLDELRLHFPRPHDDPFGVGMSLAALTPLAEIFIKRGTDVLLIADVVTSGRDIEAIRSAAAVDELTVVRLDVSPPAMHDRLSRRETEGDLQWFLDNSPRLQRTMVEQGIGDIVVATDGLSPQEVAAAVATRSGLGP